MERKFFADKVRAGWFGKCLAGAVGMPYEGVPFALNLTEKDLRAVNVPNDDLELQLVWLEALERRGTALSCRDLGDIWKRRIPHGCDEYSIAIYNLQHRLTPPATGYYNNYFADGMGAAIRSEIWALVFAGRPDAAAYFARQDAEVDHWGDGVRAECFMAMAEAHACVHSDIEAAVRFALKRTAPESRLYRTLSEVLALYDRGTDDESARREIMLTLQNHPNFTDCVMNLAFVMDALLRGGGDFRKTILRVVNFGRDTDCTAASCGAFLGIARGMAAFPEQYRSAVADEMALSDFVLDIPGVPRTISELTARTVDLHDRLFPQLAAAEYPAYTPYRPAPDLPVLYTAKWLILDGENADAAAVEAALRAEGRCPEPYRADIVTFHSPYLDLSRFAGTAHLHLFCFLEAGDLPEDTVFMATADVGLRVHLDGKLILNNHSRHKMLPAFHRVQGGAAFALPLRPGRRYLLHLELFHCSADCKACVMLGNSCNDILDGYTLGMA
ncbi:MAG: ADP-ribosylglycohydrolase family protein [Lentisphaeria bacterium]|nr:ADP-ribosylglycohydrolase family protein [Lentisphaeria bacterium]